MHDDAWCHKDAQKKKNKKFIKRGIFKAVTPSALRFIRIWDRGSSRASGRLAIPSKFLAGQPISSGSLSRAWMIALARYTIEGVCPLASLVRSTTLEKI
jgi:hypothetical protein